MTLKAQTEKPRAKTIQLDTDGKHSLQILVGPPETVTMKSGLVVLVPSKSVGKHSTGQHEELLVVLEGSGEMTFGDGSVFDLDLRTLLRAVQKQRSFNPASVGR